METRLWHLIRWFRRFNQIPNLPKQLPLHPQLECQEGLNQHCWIKPIRCYDNCWILSSHLMFEWCLHQVNWRCCPICWTLCSSNCWLESQGCSHPSQESRKLRIMLGFLINWSLRRSQLHQEQQLIVILWITISWLLIIIRKSRMRWWFDGQRLQIRCC